MEKIIIYTDGSSKGNPGPGGWAAVIESRSMNHEVRIEEIGGNEKETTNNRMEMRAAIEALKNIEENSEVEINSDSEYLINGITKWIKGWQKNNWQTKDKREVLNKDLWEELFLETEKRKVEWKKVAGHSGHKENERCDLIAQSLAEGKKVLLYNGLKQGYKLFH